MSDMRVLLLSQAFHGGGAERSARELFEHLPTVGVKPEMWLGQPETNLPTGVRVIRSATERCLYPLALFPAVNDWRHFGTRKKIDAIQPSDFDLVHIHNLHGHWLSLHAIHRLCNRMPVVWTLHDEWAATRGIPYDLTRVLTSAEARRHARWVIPLVLCYSGIHSKKWRQILGATLPAVSRFISPSKYIYDLTIGSGPFEPIQFARIPYGLTLLDEPAMDADQDGARLRLGLPKHGPVVLLVAAQLWSPFKGMSFGIEALERTCGRIRNATRLKVLLHGRGAERLARSVGRCANVVTGFATNSEDLALSFRAADVVLQPSIADNFPYVVLEALACRRPVIAFRIGGMPEMIGFNERGLLAHPFKAHEMSTCLMALLDNEAYRASLGAAGFSWVSELCNMQDYLTNLCNLYTSACDSFNRDCAAC
jgi:glycosyltransferase involved in cell wall biosynthesis